MGVDGIYVLFCAAGRLYYLRANKFELLNLQARRHDDELNRLPPRFFLLLAFTIPYKEMKHYGKREA